MPFQRFGLVVAVAAALPLTAQTPAIAQQAQTNWTGFYVGIQGGGAWGGSTHVDDSSSGSYVAPRPKLRGATGGITAGFNYQIEDFVLGVEADGSLADIKGRSGNTVDFGCGGGCGTDIQNFATIRARLGYAIGDFLPYVTGGGAVLREKGYLSPYVTDTHSTVVPTVGGGIEYNVGYVAGMSVKAEYLHFFDTRHFLYDSNGSCGTPGCAIRSTSFNVARIGINYRFNSSPAAAVAAPVVAPQAKSFLVFFDWDRSSLTDRARVIIKEAADSSKATAHTQIEVNGYADTSGSPKYNMGLSMKRAQTVAAELVRNGVAKKEIVIKAFGDTVLLVPTGPGVREPQNRRVEIIIR